MIRLVVKLDYRTWLRSSWAWRVAYRGHLKVKMIQLSGGSREETSWGLPAWAAETAPCQERVWGGVAKQWQGPGPMSSVESHELILPLVSQSRSVNTCTVGCCISFLRLCKSDLKLGGLHRCFLSHVDFLRSGWGSSLPRLAAGGRQPSLASGLHLSNLCLCGHSPFSSSSVISPVSYENTHHG